MDKIKKCDIVKYINLKQGCFQKGKYWYKINLVGCEADAEYLATVVLKNSNISNYVSYQKSQIEKIDVCTCEDFLQKDEIYITFEEVCFKYQGELLTDLIKRYRTCKDRINKTIEIINNYTYLDITDYLRDILSLDRLLLNEDRHFKNLGVIRNINTRKYKIAPIFDNGRSLGSDFRKFLPDMNYYDIIKLSVSRPFSLNFEEQVAVLGNHIIINYNSLGNELDSIPNSRAKEVLKIQLERYKKIYDGGMKV